MTDTTPPTGYPFDERQDSGEFYVPADLWSPWYVEAEPSYAQKNAYWECGVSVTEPVEIPTVRGVGGNRNMDPATFVETKSTRQLVNLSGPEGYPRWLHFTRIDLAVNARRSDEMSARIQASQPRCGVCGAVGVYPVTAPGFPPARAPSGLFACERHLGVVGFELARRLAAIDTAELLDDGRRVADAVDDLLDGVFPTVVVS